MKRSFFKNVMSLAVVAVASLAITATSGSAATTLTYDFDVVGDDGATIDFWTDVFSRAPSFPSGTVWGSVTGGRATGGYARWPEHTGGNQDSAHPNHIMRSPVFSLSATSSIDFQIGGGTGSANTYAKSSDIDPTGNSSGSGQQKFYLRRVSDDTYLLNQRRGSSASNWQSFTWDSATIGAAIAGDAANEKYTVEWVDTYSGSWGFGMIDDVVLNNVLTGPVTHEVAGDNTIGVEALTGTQSNEVYAGGVAGRFVQIKNNGTASRRMDIGEVEAFALQDIPTVDNAGTNQFLNPSIDLAYSGSAAGASVYAKGADSGFSQPHGSDDDPRLIDARETDGADTWSSNGVGNYVTIDLGDTFTLGAVRVHQRNGCCQDRLRDFSVNIFADNAGAPGALVDSVSYPGQPANQSFGEISWRTLASADLTAKLNAYNQGYGYSYVFELGSADVLEVDNPDPSIFTTILDINGAKFELELPGGPLGPGSYVFDILEADEIRGTYAQLILPQYGDHVWDTSNLLVDGTIGLHVPEPATMALLGLAACGLGGYVRGRRKA